MNSADYGKTWLADSLNQLATQKALTAIQQTGRALPCSVVAVSGQIVTVKFEVQGTFTLPQVTMPIATSRYDWLPIQVGDPGYTAPADVYLGGISGLGGGIANMSQRGNLTTLVFTPVSNAAWTAANVNQRVVQGPAGVLIKTTNGAIYIDLTTADITINGNIILTGSLTASGDVIANSGANQVSLTNHTTSGVTSGSETSGPPVPGT